MKRRKTPPGLVDPSPAPWLDVSPGAVSIRRPAYRHAGWHPISAFVRISEPLAVVRTQVGHARYGRIHISRHRIHRRVLPAILLAAPLVEIVLPRGGLRRGGQFAEPGKLAGLLRTDGVSRTLAVHFGLALPRRDHE